MTYEFEIELCGAALNQARKDLERDTLRMEYLKSIGGDKDVIKALGQTIKSLQEEINYLEAKLNSLKGKV